MSDFISCTSISDRGVGPRCQNQAIAKADYACVHEHMVSDRPKCSWCLANSVKMLCTNCWRGPESHLCPLSVLRVSYFDGPSPELQPSSRHR